MEKQEKESKHEKIKLAVLSGIAAGKGNLNSKEGLEALKDELDKSEWEGNINNFPAKITFEGENFTIEANGEVIINGEANIVQMASAVQPTNYGDKVEGYSVLQGDNKVDDWQIYYKDGNNIWLIASDYVKIDDTTKTATGMTVSSGGYNVYWNTVPDLGEELSNKNCVNALTDITKWNSYVDNELAIKAMGAPTMEMFVNSYNAKYSDRIALMYRQNQYGYEVKWENQSDENWGAMLSGLSDTESNGMYLKTKKIPDDLQGKPTTCWLAAPSGTLYNQKYGGTIMNLNDKMLQGENTVRRRFNSDILYIIMLA